MRYHTSHYVSPNFAGSLVMAGPQDESQISQQVKDILAKEGIEAVVIFYSGGSTGQKAVAYRPIAEPKG